MDPPILSPITPRLAAPRGHSRTPSRSPTRTRITDDLLSDLSPATTLEAFTNPSGKLRASIEAATPVERAFGMRATMASNKIQEWADELSAWPWPGEKTSAGFEMPLTKRRRTSASGGQERASNSRRNDREEEPEYIGSLTVQEVNTFETRIDEITEDMEDLNVEEIKRQVLDTHFSPKSRPSSSASNAPMPRLFASYTKMDDFTAVITATVLQSLPNLSKLMRLMEVWNVRMAILRKVPPLLTALEDAEVALKSGWTALDVSENQQAEENGEASDIQGLSRQIFEIIRDVLQDKVTSLGQELDFMLDTLEGRQDTLPEQWLDRMESIEQNYGDWVVAGDRKVREREWARRVKARREAEDALRLEQQEEAETARRGAELRLKADNDAEKTREEASKKAAEGALVEQQATRQNTSNPQQTAEYANEPSEASQGELLYESIRSHANPYQPHSEPMTNIADELSVPLSLSPINSNGAGDADLPDNVNLASGTAGAVGLLGPGAKLLLIPQHQSDCPTTENHDLEKSVSDGTKLAVLDGNWSDAEASTHTPDEAIQPSSLNDEGTIDIRQTGSSSRFGHKEEQDVSLSGHQNLEIPGSLSPIAEKLANPTSEIQTLDMAETRSSTSLDYDGRGYEHGVNTEVQPLSPAFDRSQADATIPHQMPSLAPLGTSPSKISMHNVTVPTPANSVAESLASAMTDAYTSGVSGKVPEKLLIKSIRLENGIVESYNPQPQISNSKPSSEQRSHRNEESDASESSPTNGHVSGYSTSDPTPLILEAEPAMYFTPVLSPITSPVKAPRSPNDALDSPRTPTTSKLKQPYQSAIMDNSHISSDSQVAPVLPGQLLVPGMLEGPSYTVPHSEHHVAGSGTISKAEDSPVSRNDGSYGSLPFDIEMDVRILHPQSAQPESSEPHNTADQSLKLVEGESTRSPGSIMVTRYIDDAIPSSPFPVSSPLSEGDVLDSFSEIDEPSPTAGRVGQRIKWSHEYSPPDSPTMPAISRYRPLEPLPSHKYSQVELNNAPLTPVLDVPILENVEVSEAPILSSPKKPSGEQSTDDQIQQQISNILESIPARIVLTSEPENEASNNEMLQPKKTRRPSIPSYRSHSSLSTHSRAPTPSFTLAPAYGKGSSRPRPQNGNPEIKLYHLSRSTGEAPIKLFVRLVGEHGERVMVRVGGGWADLGEYLREYASHHGRRSVSGENDKVEVQSIPPRIVSNSSTTSSVTVRGGYTNGRSSPVSRPASAFDRPMSSLAVRRTRQSLTSENDSSLSLPRPREPRSPSTPLPLLPHRKPVSKSTVETPPSASSALGHSASRSSSRLSWTEDDSSLGLAGPKSRKVVISERDAEWVESVKEKVRLASAEKDKEREKEKERDGRAKPAGPRKEMIASFGELEKVGTTKRLFRKG